MSSEKTHQTPLLEIEFIASLSEEFGIDPKPSPESSLWDDLDFDSVDMVDLVLFIEELAQLEVVSEPEMYPVIVFVRDAYDYYTDLAKNDCI
jgi:acyl carrier protein